MRGRQPLGAAATCFLLVIGQTIQPSVAGEYDLRAGLIWPSNRPKWTVRYVMFVGILYKPVSSGFVGIGFEYEFVFGAKLA